ncbi:MAG: hypothetical protein RMM08_12665 [Armatimonadota bacterium]|nr:hypothetical protein [bacterium]MDW8322203.1 hypothetical protein [Armatimonadota bacterium]
MSDTEQAEPYTLQWKVHLLRKQPRRAWLAGVVMLHASVLVAVAFQSVGMGLLALALLWLATREFWLPVRYYVNEKGAGVRYLGAIYDITWDRVKYVLVNEEGVKLSPLPFGSRLEPFRGVFLRFADNREQVLEAIAFWREGSTTGKMKN